MLNKRIALVALAGLLALAVVGGCGKKLEQKVVGKYKGEMTLPESAKKDAVAKAGADTVKAVMSSLALELKADKTFNMTVMVAIEGKWVIEGETLTLTAEKVGGMTLDQIKSMAAAQGKSAQTSGMDKPMKFKIGDDGATLTAVPDPSKKDEGSMVFKKEKTS